MKYANYTILLKEIPGKISLCFAMTWCPIKCPWCHSYELWDKTYWIEITKDWILSILKKYEGLFDIVLFFWWEWNWIQFMDLLKYLKEQNYSLGLYTGSNMRLPYIEKYLDYIKIWSFDINKGWLESITTNQRLYDLKNWWKDITEEFWKDYILK